MRTLRRKPLIVSALLALMIGACATIEELAPPVDDTMLRAAGVDQTAAAQIERGRALYVTDCVRCHSPEPVMRYSAQQWRQIIPRMATEAALREEDRAAVEAYVMVVLSARGR
ncbi:MAG: cytochrome c [Phycisphaerales bacterium]|nr:cytochrome c [Phycisphaerales bacterium]